MTRSFRFFVDGTPEPQGSKRVVRNRLIDASPKTRLWRAMVTDVAEIHIPVGWDIAGGFDVDLRFTFPRPKAHYGSLGAVKTRYYHALKTSRPDVDKLARCVLDALTGCVWHDDAQVTHLEASKGWGDTPGLECRITRIRED